MSGHEDKAKRYMSLLDAARVSGSWNELPELIRKVTKHAHTQKLLIQTATAEHDVIARIERNKPSTATEPSTSIQSLQSLVKEHEVIVSEELLQARTCVAWAAWTGAITDTGALQPFKLEGVRSEFDKWGQQNMQTWTKICLVKAAYIQGATLLKSGDRVRAHAILDTAVSWISLNQDMVATTPQLTYWCEQLLAQKVVDTDDQAVASEETLQTFRLWSASFAKLGDKSPNVYGNKPSAHIVRFLIWKRYYSSLSAALRVQPSISNLGISRLQLTRELRSVESSYETELLRTQKFPRASESNNVIEGWVEQVVQNWCILCGPDWRDGDLGEGGRNAVTRNVLDILYRAASKTFQSTLILRRLFQVHKALTEFDLAYRCLDTYIELIERERSRSAKSQTPDSNQESDETVLLTISEGILGLCSFGRGQEARKAFSLAKKLEDWLSGHLADISPGHPTNGEVISARPLDMNSQNGLTSRSLEIIYRALGIAKANWARWTPFNETRSGLQSDALESLRNACNAPDVQLDTTYALALLLSETREIDGAIQCVKNALQHKIGIRSSTPSWILERKLMPFWHLMALLLSSRQDFDTASRSCTAAFEQFSSSEVLLGGTRGGDKGSSTEKEMTEGAEALVDDMECDELQRMVELQISHVALMELLEGPESALKGSNDLLALYSRLFARFEIELDLKKGQQTVAPPQSSAGTVKSFRGSIFSRKKAVAQSSLNAPAKSTTPAATPRPATRTGHAPIIHVTHEAGNSAPDRHHVLRRSQNESSASEKVKVTKKTAAKHHSHGLEASSREAAAAESNSAIIGDASTIPPSELSSHGELTSTGPKDLGITEKHETDPGSKQHVSEIPHNLASHERMAPPGSHSERPQEQDVRLPTVNAPVPRFSKKAAQKHALMILNKIWLVIATLYRRGNMFEDAREACDEASKAASKIESLFSASSPSARALTDPGWGGSGKSSDEIFADVFCEKAKLVLAIVSRREEEGQTANADSMREAAELFEQCLMYYPNHAGGIIGLSNLLLDYYEKKIELGKRVDDGRSSTQTTHKPQLARAESFPEVANGTITPAYDPLHPSSMATSSDDYLRKTPENLNRIAARDRAYGLLSNLTKLGGGWDDSEAWYALARAHELGGEIEKAKSILWWCIELEDTRPIRRWENLSCNGYVL